MTKVDLMGLASKFNDIKISTDSSLTLAIRDNNITLIKSLLASGVNTEGALQEAVGLKNKKIVTLLIKNGVDVNCRSTGNKTALDIAIENNNMELVELLCNFEADINGNAFDTLNPLHKAILRSNYQVSNYLIQQGADVDAKYWDQTPLYMAVDVGSEEIVKLLLEKKASVDVRLNSGETILTKAIKSGNYEIFELLLNAGATINPPITQKIPLHVAILCNNYQITECLINRGADFKSYINSTSALEMAINNENDKIVELLIKNKVDVNKTEKKFSETCLNKSIKKNNQKIIELLLDAGADVQGNSEFRQVTPLYLSVCENNLKFSENLIARGADVNAVSWEVTPLYKAIYMKNKEITRLLLRNNVNVNADVYGKTVLGLAVELKDDDLVQILISVGADINCLHKSMTPLYMAVNYQNYSLAKYLIKLGANSNIECEHQTALHLIFDSEFHSTDKFAKLLIDNKAYVSARGRYYETCLSKSINLERNNKITEMLVDNDAEINELFEDKTPLQVAVNREDHDMVKFLLLNGADVNLLSPEDNSSDKIIADHIVKLKAARFYLTPENLQIVSENYQELYNGCCSEIKIMETKKVTTSNFTYYDVLSLPRYKLAIRLTHVDHTVKEFSKANIKSKFPIYGEMINHRLSKAVKRKILSMETFEILCDIYSKIIPSTVVRELMDYFSNHELHIISC